MLQIMTADRADRAAEVLATVEAQTEALAHPVKDMLVGMHIRAHHIMAAVAVELAELARHRQPLLAEMAASALIGSPWEPIMLAVAAAALRS